VANGVLCHSRYFVFHVVGFVGFGFLLTIFFENNGIEYYYIISDDS
jgi:hypothetical protein